MREYQYLRFEISGHNLNVKSTNSRVGGGCKCVCTRTESLNPKTLKTLAVLLSIRAWSLLWEYQNLGNEIRVDTI